MATVATNVVESKLGTTAKRMPPLDLEGATQSN